MSTLFKWADSVSSPTAFRAQTIRAVELRLLRRTLMLLAPVAIVLAASCTDSVGPGRGALRISIQVTGDDPDLDGFTVRLDSAEPIALDHFNTVFNDSVSTGRHVVAIGGVAANCLVEGDSSIAVRVGRSAIAEVKFTVRCEYTGIRVTIRTTGIDPPPAYSITIDTTSGLVSSTGATIFSRLPPGSHTVTLSRISANCTSSDLTPKTVTVSNRLLTQLEFDFTCRHADNRIAFVIDSVSRGFVGSYIAIANADAPERFAVAPGNSPIWSPDGARIAYSTTICYDYYGWVCAGKLVIGDFGTTFSAKSFDNTERGLTPAWSPDGTMLAFARVSQIDSIPRTLEMFLLDRALTTVVPTPGFDAGHPSWSPDGQLIVFQCVSQEGPRVADICVINRDGTGLRKVTDDATYDGSPSWSPDGSLIAFETSTPGSDIHVDVIAPDGTGRTQLAKGSSPAWSPDGSRIIYEDASGLFMISPNGSNLTRVTTGRHHTPSWRK